jgi:hypothetical protein
MDYITSTTGEMETSSTTTVTESMTSTTTWMSSVTEEDVRMTSLENITTPSVTDATFFELPLDMRFNEGHVLSIATYSVLLVISATGNITVLSLLLQRRRKTHSRINTMLLHLAIADLLVSINLFIL